MTVRVEAFGPGYDAKLSTAGALNAAEELLDSWRNKDMAYEELTVRIAANRFWVAVAQVHATAALVYATEAAAEAKKTCRCR